MVGDLLESTCSPREARRRVLSARSDSHHVDRGEIVPSWGDDSKWSMVSVESILPLGRHDQLTQTWRRVKAQHLLLRRIDQLKRRLGVSEHDLIRLITCQSARVDVMWQRASFPWKWKSIVAESHLDIKVSVSQQMLQLTDPQLESLIVRTALIALGESGLSTGVSDELAGESSPLLQVGAVPAEGSGDRWASSADVDAYAKAARVIGDIAEPWLAEAQLMSSWPVLELVPRRQVREIAPMHGSRQYEVPLPKGFAQWAEDARARQVMGDLEVALRLRAASDRADWEPMIDDLVAKVEATGFELRVRTAKLREPGTPWVRVEYEADVNGGRCRAVVGGEGPEVASEWIPVGAGAASIITLEPNAAYGRRPDGRVWMAVPRARPARFLFDPRGVSEVAAFEADSALDEGSLPVAHPAFSAHFTDPLYADAGVDFGPFGSDEGFELVCEWAGRRAELGPDATVAQLLGEEVADTVDRWTRRIDLAACSDPAALVDEAVWVQSAGFTLLRLTGRIDPAGKTLTLNALEFLIAFYDAPAEYVTQRDDLASWSE